MSSVWNAFSEWPQALLSPSPVLAFAAMCLSLKTGLCGRSFFHAFTVPLMHSARVLTLSTLPRSWLFASWTPGSELPYRCL